MDIRQLDEHPLRRSVRVPVEAEHADAFAVVEVDRPDRPLELRVDHRRLGAADGTRDDELAVGRHDRVVHAAEHANELDLLELLRVDDVDAAVVAGDGRVHALAVLADGYVVRRPRQRDPLDDFQRGRIDHVERRQRFIGDVDAAAVGRGLHAVADLDALDLADDGVGRRIDQRDAQACKFIDEPLIRRQSWRGRQ